MARLQERTLVFYLVAGGALALFLGYLSQVANEGRERVRYEDLALESLRRLAAAEVSFHGAQKRYGWVEDLEGAGLLEDMELARDGTLRYLETPRYRLAVLLPHTVNRDDMVAVALRSAGRRNPDLEARHFSVVARPWGDALTGYRTFCIDESGRVYVSEGVSDMAARKRRPLPELHLPRGGPLVTGGMRWYPIDDLPKR